MAKKKNGVHDELASVLADSLNKKFKDYNIFLELSQTLSHLIGAV